MIELVEPRVTGGLVYGRMVAPHKIEERER
jgi:hypothetical protein